MGNAKSRQIAYQRKDAVKRSQRIVNDPITSQKSRPSHKHVDWKWDDYPNVIYGYR
jgi:hypothetical protein